MFFKFLIYHNQNHNIQNITTHNVDVVKGEVKVYLVKPKNTLTDTTLATISTLNDTTKNDFT